MVVGVERNPAMQAAEAAVAWAKEPYRDDPSITNYERLLLDALHAARSTDSSEPIMLQMRGMAASHWACLSRLLVMDRPELAERIHPHFTPVLDGQAGTTWLQLVFADVTGRRPKVRSWRHARGAVAR